MTLSKILDEIQNGQDTFLSNKKSSERKLIGQYFTNIEIAKFMASFINYPKDRKDNTPFRILDAGAGAGILAITAIIQCLDKGCKNIFVELFENDEALNEVLKSNLERINEFLLTIGVKFDYKINTIDFVLSRPDKNIGVNKFDLSIINPPYFKYSNKESKYFNATTDLFTGNPNIYASFMAVVNECLKTNGQLIAIIPRSFTNGLYFKGFRKYLLCNSSFESIHIFKTRNQLFKKVDVLQENIICSLSKNQNKGNISITSSVSIDDISSMETNKYPYKIIVDTKTEHNFIRIPESKEDFEFLKNAESLDSTFSKSGYNISTGPVVEHRTSEFLTSLKNAGNCVPLIKVHNLKVDNTIKFEGNLKDTSFKLIQGSEKHLVKNRIYVITRRITSKDEPRRIVASIYTPKNQHDYIGISNRLNYISLKEGELSFAEALGLTAVLNSNFIDRYFRSISGNTQVNATEVRLLSFPTREKIIELGEAINKTQNYSYIQTLLTQIVGI